MAETSEVVALAKKLSDLEQLMADIRAAESAGRWIRRIRLLTILGVLVGAVWFFYQKANAFVSEPNLKKIADLAQQRLKDKTTQEAVQRAAQLLLDNVQKPVMTAFTKQIQKDSPLYIQSLNKEGTRLLDDLPKHIEAQVDKHYRLELAKNIKLFEKEFPEMGSAKEQEAMIGNLALALTSLSKKYYGQEVKTESDRLLDTWKNFPLHKRTGPAETPLDDQLVEALLEFMWFQSSELTKAPSKSPEPSKQPSK